MRSCLSLSPTSCCCCCQWQVLAPLTLFMQLIWHFAFCLFFRALSRQQIIINSHRAKAEADTETQTAQIICARIKKEDEPVWVAPSPRSPLTTYFLCPLKAAFDSEQTSKEREREGGACQGTQIMTKPNEFSSCSCQRCYCAT